MKHYKITVNSRTLEVQVLSDPRLEEVEVEVDGQRFVVGVQRVSDQEKEGGSKPLVAATSAPTPPQPAVSATTALSGKSVTAPLPGVIKAVVAQPGQQVAIGDHLLVIEAMKMDNVIRAPRKGTIATVHVAEGHRVAHGQLIVEYRE